MNPWVQFLKENWGVIVSAPLPFLAVLVLGILSGWGWSWTVLKERLAHRDDLIRHYENVAAGKLPPLADRSATLRSRKMMVGLSLVFGGLFVALLGAFFVVNSWPKSTVVNAPAQSKQQPASNFEGGPLAWNKTPLLGWQTQADGSVQVRSVGVSGRNLGSKEIQLKNTYLLSGITGERIDLKIHAHLDGMIPFAEANPIPPNADISLSSEELNETAGVKESDFLRDWGVMHLVSEYEGGEHRMTFGREAFEQIFAELRPKPLPPHVTKRQ